MVKSSSSSGIFFQGDMQPHVAENPHLGPNCSNTFPLSNAGQISRDSSYTVLNNVECSGPNNQANSLVTDANSGVSGSPHIQRSSSVTTEPYMRLPASPVSFSSNNIAVSGSCTMDGSSVVQPSPSQYQLSEQRRARGRGHMVASSVAYLSGMRQAQFANDQRVLGFFTQDVNPVARLPKRPCFEINQEDTVQQQALQQFLQRHDSSHFANSNIEQKSWQQEQQQKFLQAMTQNQRVQVLQQSQQELPISQQLQVQGMLPVFTGPRPYEVGVCSRRLMQYFYHERQRPDNSIAYWRKFVAEYYSPCAKKRWCLSRYNYVGHRSTGMIPQRAMDAWQCDLCGSKSGRGFEVTFEVLPRLHEVKFGSGVIDELLFLDLPCEFRFTSGIMMLEYAKAVQESVYEQVRVVREGQLRIMFTPDLKILSWEFCSRRHEEFLPRRLVASQVNQLLQVAQTCHSALSESDAEEVSPSDLKSNSVIIAAAGHQFVRSLELQSLNELGFSKSYVRCLQISDVVNSMKDLMDFSREYKQGPLEGLKNLMMHATDHTRDHQVLPTDANNLMNIQRPIDSQRTLSGSPQASAAWTNCQTTLTKENSINSPNSPFQNEPIQAQFSKRPGPSRFLPEISPTGMLLQQYLQGPGEKNDRWALYSQNQGGYSCGPSGLGFRSGPWAGRGRCTSRSDSLKVASSENEPTLL